MTDTAEPAEEQVVETTPEATDPAETPTDWAAEAAKWKALSRKNEARANENADKAKRFDEFEEAQKSEQQKLLERAQRAEGALAASEMKALRASIAAKHNVPEALLSGSDEESIEQSAQALVAFRGSTPAAPSAEGQGKAGDPISSGLKPITSLDELNKLSPEEVNKARRDGRLNALLGIS